jgi:hypothetical protein
MLRTILAQPVGCSSVPILIRPVRADPATLLAKAVGKNAGVLSRNGIAWIMPGMH